jgi:hypothetical protein
MAEQKQAVSFDELALSNMFIVQALVELLSEKGLLSQKEVFERVQKLKREAATKSVV